jgi:3-oxoadipate enol-lactonase
MLRDIGGVRLNVLDEGAGQAVLFLHGLGGCWRDWEPQVESWRADHRVVVVEHRGHGRSDRVAGPYSTDQLAADALAACHLRGVEHAYVVGLSMGGMIAQKLALAEPGFVDALVLCNTFLRPGSARAAGLRRAAGLVRAEGLGALDTLMSGDSGAWPAAGDAGAVTRNNLRDAEGNDPDCWAAAAEAICDHDTSGAAGEIAAVAPVLVVWGADDPAVPVKLARPLADAVGAEDTVVLDGAGHACNLERAEAFDAALRNFFARHPASPIPPGGGRTTFP